MNRHPGAAWVDIQIDGPERHPAQSPRVSAPLAEPAVALLPVSCKLTLLCSASWCWGWALSTSLLCQKAQWLRFFRSVCLTTGRRRGLPFPVAVSNGPLAPTARGGLRRPKHPLQSVDSQWILPRLSRLPGVTGAPTGRSPVSFNIEEGSSFPESSAGTSASFLEACSVHSCTTTRHIWCFPRAFCQQANGQLPACQPGPGTPQLISPLSGGPQPHSQQVWISGWEVLGSFPDLFLP